MSQPDPTTLSPAPYSPRASTLQAFTTWTPPTGDEIQKIVHAIGLSAEEIAEFVGVTTTTIARWTLEQEQITYSCWMVLCMRAGLGQEGLEQLATVTATTILDLEGMARQLVAHARELNQGTASAPEVRSHAIADYLDECELKLAGGV